MKINKLMFAVMAGAMLTACSDDVINDLVEPQEEIQTSSNGAQGYIGVSIGMPSEAQTRGANDQFDDGLKEEYDVYTAALIFFKSPKATPTDASNPEFFKAYRLGAGEWNTVNDNPAQITQNSIVTFPVDFAKINEDLWVLAVINYDGELMSFTGSEYSVTVNGKDGKTTFKEAEEGETPMTFKDFMALATDHALRSDNNGFFMTNAPYSSVAGTTGINDPDPVNPQFQVLSKVNKGRIFETEQAATQMPAAAIFVERALAKVEVNSSNLKIGDGSINFPEGTFNISSVQWNLDNLEPSTFIVRNLDANAQNTTVPYWALYDTDSTNPTLTYHYRFLGAASFGHTKWPNTPDPTEHYRTYFGVDPHGAGINEGTSLLPGDGVFTPTGSANPQYCKENTFDVAHMDYRNTTRAVIKVKFGDGTNLYTVGEDKKNVYIFDNAASYLAWDILYNDDVIKAWKDYFDAQNKTYANNANINNLVYDRTARTAENEWMKITMKTDETLGRLVVNKIVLKNGDAENPQTITFNDATEKNVIAKVNKEVTVKYYKEGVAYYAVRIRHFGNDLAPWTSVEETTKTTVDAYGKNSGNGGVITEQDIKNYLGRYGVLRNNWYVLNLGDILQMGEPVKGDLPLDGTPDDRVIKEESITCRINIMSWAKRNQTDNL